MNQCELLAMGMVPVVNAKANMFFDFICNRIPNQCLSPRIIAVSSGAVYRTTQPLPLTEQSETSHDTSPYAASKLAMEKCALDFKNKGLDCVVVRPFNHIGPGQGLGFLVPDLYKSIAEAGRGHGEVRVGNLTTKRDYTDVRDVAAAYLSLLQFQGPLSHAIYNVSSGHSTAGEEILNIMIEKMNFQKKVKIIKDPARFRPSDNKD